MCSSASKQLQICLRPLSSGAAVRTFSATASASASAASALAQCQSSRDGRWRVPTAQQPARRLRSSMSDMSKGKGKDGEKEDDEDIWSWLPPTQSTKVPTRGTYVIPIVDQVLLTLEEVKASLEGSGAENVKIIDMKGNFAQVAHFVIAEGRSVRHVRALCSTIVKSVRVYHSKTTSNTARPPATQQIRPATIINVVLQ
jgi:hypothetical protein